MINQIISHQKSILFLNFANIKGCTAQTHCVLQHNLRGLLPHAMSSDSVRNPIGRRTESDRTANGIRLGGERNLIGRRTVSSRGCSCLNCTNRADRHVRSVGALSALIVHHLLGWCTYCSVGALETSAPPKRHQHLCKSVKSVGLILSKSEFRGSCWQGVQLSQLHQPSKRREYSHRIRGTHRTVWRRCAAHR